ncbi:MAG: spore coat protein [Clostridiales bacterium]|nr:spore coat protein [Clostridiales bacterium]
MTLTQKETTLLKDLRSQEQICVEKYTKYANEACDCQLKDIFTQIGQAESQHLQTLDQISSGTVPAMNTGSGKNAMPTITPSSSSSADKQKDAFLCSDILATEKHVSSEYNTCIFEFNDTNIREALNHIQKEEQQHGEQIYRYMSANGMYS